MVEIILNHEKVLKVVAKNPMYFLEENFTCFWVPAPSSSSLSRRLYIPEEMDMCAFS